MMEILQILIYVLLILAVAIVAFAIWYFGRRLVSRGTTEGRRTVDRPTLRSTIPDAYRGVDASLRQTVENYGHVREEIGQIAESSRQSADEVRRIARELREKHDLWAKDFCSLSSYKVKTDRRLDEAIENWRGEMKEIHEKLQAQIDGLESQIKKEICPWVMAMEDAVEIPENETKYLLALVAYIEGLSPDLPKYLSGVEAAVSQLGHFIYRVLNQKPPEASDALFADISLWFSKLHPGHQLKIPVVGDGYDDRFHKDVSSQLRDKGAVSIVAEVLNWGLMEVGSSQRTVIKAEVKCRS